MKIRHFPLSTMSFENYKFHATADAIEDGDLSNCRNYKLYLHKGMTSQLLSEIEQLESTVPVIRFIGDMDGDGLPDFLMQEGFNYEYHKLVLYLSSYAADGAFVKAVATDEEWRDC